MNFYKELDKEFKNAGLEGKIIEVPDELKPTAIDYEELERNISIKTNENEEMLFLSSVYASNNLPCQKLVKMKNKEKYENK